MTTAQDNSVELIDFETFKTLDVQQMVAFVKAYGGHKNLPEEYRAFIYGDCNPNRDMEKHLAYRTFLMERYQAGLPMCREDQKRARRYIRGELF